MSTATKGLPQIIAELKKIQQDHSGKPMPEDVSARFSALAAEAKAMQDEADRAAEIKKFESFAAEVPDAVLPGQPGAREAKADAYATAGYISLGELFVNSEAFRAYKSAGMPMQRGSEPVVTDSVVRGKDGKVYAALTGDQRKAVESALRETKAVPTLGTGVIDPQRLDVFVQATRPAMLRIRDLVNVSRTGSNAVEYLYETSYTRAAAPVADAAAKPQAAAAYEIKTATVRTHAVWIPVTEQMLADAPQIINLVNNRLLYDLDKLEEEEMVYGSGSGQHFEGITNNAGVLAARTVGGDTNLDKIRRGITDVRRAGYEPNGVAIDPIDWEGIVLLKGSDDRYVWSVVTDDNGSRVWGLRVVETVGMEEVAGNTTEERNIVVGDWQRGATLWVRSDAAVQVGWQNDDFTKNLRTIRAERREAFAVTAPKAFRKVVAQAAVA
jgi:HK97 family phage major capsid protein